MTELPPEALALLERARAAHDPREADRERVLGGLHATLGMAMAGGLAATATATATASAAESAASSVASAAGSTAWASWKGALFTWKASKIILATVAVGGAVGLGVAAPRNTPQAERTSHALAPNAPLAHGASRPQRAVVTPPAPEAVPALVEVPASDPAPLAERALAPSDVPRSGAAPAEAHATRDDAQRDPLDPQRTRDQGVTVEAAPGANDDLAAHRRTTRDALAMRASPSAIRTARARERVPSGSAVAGKRAPAISATAPAPAIAADLAAPSALPAQPLDNPAPAQPPLAAALDPQASAERAANASDPLAGQALSESELTLIRRALTSLRDHDNERALSVLARHAAQFPNGAFTMERRGLRVVALCAAGRSSEGRNERATFLREAGESPIAARVRRACDEPPQ